MCIGIDGWLNRSALACISYKYKREWQRMNEWMEQIIRKISIHRPERRYFGWLRVSELKHRRRHYGYQCMRFDSSVHGKWYENDDGICRAQYTVCTHQSTETIHHLRVDASIRSHFTWFWCRWCVHVCHSWLMLTVVALWIDLMTHRKQRNSIFGHKTEQKSVCIWKTINEWKSQQCLPSFVRSHFAIQFGPISTHLMTFAPK